MVLNNLSNCIRIRIGCWKPVVGILKMYQRGLAVAVRLLFKQTPLRSSDNHETSTPARMLVRAGKPGHFANLGYPLASLRSRDYINKIGSTLLLTKLYKEQK